MMHREDEAFWPSYVDLMTSLFIIMLVLFVFSYAAFSVEKQKLVVEASNYRRLVQIDAAIGALKEKGGFDYDQKYKRYLFHQDVDFKTGDATIDPKYYPQLISGGRAIGEVVQSLKKAHPNEGVRYLIIIEGMASKDGFPGNYELSYKRALALYQFWDERNIALDKDVCEVLVAGSGTGGVGRHPSSEEAKNKRFLIQIIPKFAYQSE